MRVADALATAGGPLTVSGGSDGASVSIAALEQAVLTRAGLPVPIDLTRAIRGERHHNILVHPGDHIFVPTREGRVTILGQVGSPTVVPHRDGMRLTEALALAGGVTVDGDRSDIRLVRGPAEAPDVYSASLDAIVDGAGPDVTLAPGDVLFVTDEWLEDAREVIGVFAPVLSLGASAVLVALLATR
jgi:polysaccharide export outer membrane protein